MNLLIGLAYLLSLGRSEDIEKKFCVTYARFFVAGCLFMLFLLMLWKLSSYLLKHISWS